MKKKHHYFFAVKLPVEAKTYIKEQVLKHKNQFPFRRWVHHQDYHITLAFLGVAEAALLETAADQVSSVVQKNNRFTLTVSKAGVFGRPREPRVFWLSVNQSGQLQNIRDSVYQICLETGFKVDKKPFRPHITLARKWDASFPFTKELLNRFEVPPYTFPVEEIVLYETHLDQTPKYKEYAVFPLAGSGGN